MSLVRPEEARLLLEDALRREPTDYRLHLSYTKVFLHLGFGEEALSAANCALALAPEEEKSIALAQRATAYLLLGRREQAEQDLHAAMTRLPEVRDLITQDPTLHPLLRDRRFRALLSITDRPPPSGSALNAGGRARKAERKNEGRGTGRSLCAGRWRPAHCPSPQVNRWGLFLANADAYHLLSPCGTGRSPAHPYYCPAAGSLAGTFLSVYADKLSFVLPAHNTTCTWSFTLRFTVNTGMGSCGLKSPSQPRYRFAAGGFSTIRRTCTVVELPTSGAVPISTD